MFRANCLTSWWAKGLLLALAVTLTGCGFRLRGTYDIPAAYQHISVISDNPYGDLSLMLKERLRNAGLSLADAGDTSAADLRIVSEGLKERTLSVFENGQVAEYELLYTVQVQVKPAGNYEPVTQEIRVQRQYQDDPDKALAKSREKELLLTEMRQTAADRVLRFLATLENH